MKTQTALEKVVAQPSTAYGKPEDVLDDDSLNAAQKRRVLESWERDARELAVAEDENMGGGEPSMLDRVLDALATLPAVEERPRGPATMHGSQPAPSSRPETTSPEADALKASAAISGRREPATASTRAPTLSDEEARQAEIILKTPARQAIFIGGLILAVVAVVLAFYFAWPAGGA